MTRKDNHVIRTNSVDVDRYRPLGPTVNLQKIPLTNSIRPKVMPSYIGYDFFA